MKTLPTTADIRYANLRAHMQRTGISTTDIANLLDKGIGQVSQFAGPTKHKGIGDEIARQLEEKLGIPYYSLDSPTQVLRELGAPSVSDAQIIATPRAKIPVVGMTAAGSAIECIDLYQPGIADEWVDAYGNPGPHAFALRLEGFSMEDRFLSGDIVQIEPDLEWKPNDFVFARRTSNHHGTFKQLRVEDGRYFLFALNKEFSPRYMEVDDDWVIVGKATWKLERL